MEKGMIMSIAKLWWIALLAGVATPALAAGDAEAEAAAEGAIIVTGMRNQTNAGSKTDTPISKLPQALTIVTADTFMAQGAISISDTLNYVAGVTANPYGPDSRVDGGFIRGLNPLQFRDGMRDLFSFYASIRSDPYNFSQVEVVRGPASVLFGAGTLGGLINMVSKTPEFEKRGEVSLRYGSFDRKEALADLTGKLAEGLAGRIVARVRDSGTRVDFVPDDRVMIAPSLRWAPTNATDIKLIGLYQEDDGGSTSQFLPLFGTIYPNPNGRLKNSTFIGKPGWDRYDGRLLQGTATADHRLSEHLRISLKARYIDSDLTYLTHYPDNYTNPANPFLDPDQRQMGLYAEGSYARLNIFSTDNNVRFDFYTGSSIKHTLLAGIDYSWNRVRKTAGSGYEFIDIYDIDYAAISDYGGGLPPAFGISTSIVAQKQLGIYLQDQIDLGEKVSVMFGGRRDWTRSQAPGATAEKDHATSLRAGIIAEVLPGVSPYASYTESFEPISGLASNLRPFKPKFGRQYEGGIKLHPDEATLVTFAVYHIKENNQPVDDPGTPDPFDQMQAGSQVSKGWEVEARRSLPGDYEVIAAYSDNRPRRENVPRRNAALWGAKTLKLNGETSLRLGAGVRYASVNISSSAAFPAGVRTPSYTLFDGLAELRWRDWSAAINATNMLGKKFYSACLARGDCFIGAPRNIMATVTRRF